MTDESCETCKKFVVDKVPQEWCEKFCKRYEAIKLDYYEPIREE